MWNRLHVSVFDAVFKKSDGGSVAIWFAMASVTLMFFAGVGLDIGRSVNQKQQIQGAVDAAALAGASVYTGPTQAAAATAVANNYMANFKAASGIASLQYTPTPTPVASATGGGSVSLYTMTVTATATIDNTLMKMAAPTNKIKVSATAQNPVYNITISMSGFASNAVDSNVIYYYTVPADGSIPSALDTSILFSNNGTAPPSGNRTFQTTASQSIGFEMINTTDGNAKTTCTTFLIFQNCISNDYGSNQYNRSIEECTLLL